MKRIENIKRPWVGCHSSCSIIRGPDVPCSSSCYLPVCDISPRQALSCRAMWSPDQEKILKSWQVPTILCRRWDVGLRFLSKDVLTEDENWWTRPTDTLQVHKVFWRPENTQLTGEQAAACRGWQAYTFHLCYLCKQVISSFTFSLRGISAGWPWRLSGTKPSSPAYSSVAKEGRKEEKKGGREKGREGRR